MLLTAACQTIGEAVRARPSPAPSCQSSRSSSQEVANAVWLNAETPATDAGLQSPKPPFGEQSSHASASLPTRHSASRMLKWLRYLVPDCISRQRQFGRGSAHSTLAGAPSAPQLQVQRASREFENGWSPQLVHSSTVLSARNRKPKAAGAATLTCASAGGRTPGVFQSNPALPNETLPRMSVRTRGLSEEQGHPSLFATHCDMKLTSAAERAHEPERCLESVPEHSGEAHQLVDGGYGRVSSPTNASPEPQHHHDNLAQDSCMSRTQSSNDAKRMIFNMNFILEIVKQMKSSSTCTCLFFVYYRISSISQKRLSSLYHFLFFMH